jgi:hypothetical protein
MTYGSIPPSRPDRRASHRQRYAFAWNHPRWQWLRSRRARRLLVLGLAACLAMLCATGLLGAHSLNPPDAPPHSNLWWAFRMVLVLAYFAAFFGCLGLWQLLVGPATRGLFGLTARELDERQQLLRGRGFQRAYPFVPILFLLAMVVVVGLAVLWLPGATSGWTPRINAVMRLSFGIVFPALYAMAALPAAITAWMEPDELP